MPTAAEIERLLRAFNTRAHRHPEHGARRVLWRCGLRIAEALALQPKDLDYNRGVIHVLRAKGAKRRVVAMSPESWAVLLRWLDRRRALGLDGRQPTFCTLKGDALSPSTFVRCSGERPIGQESTGSSGPMASAMRRK